MKHFKCTFCRSQKKTILKLLFNAKYRHNQNKKNNIKNKKKTMSFSVTFEKASDFKKIIDGIKDLSNEFNIDISPQKMHIDFMDSSVVCMCDINLSSSFFKHFECKKNSQIGINPKQMCTLMKCMPDKDEMSISYEENSDKLQLSSSKNGSKIFIKMNMLNIQTDTFSVPEYEIDSEFEMCSKHFKKMATDLSSLESDIIDISVKKDEIQFFVNGSLGSATITKKSQEDMTIKHKNDVSIKFAMKYIVQFSKLFVLSDKVNIKMTRDNPLIIQYKLGEGSDMNFYLAPSIDDMDEDDDLME